MTMMRRKRTQGQAIVEFALAATLIFFLLAAAVDVGLIFFALQGMHNAAQEGATYGSRWLIDDPATGKRILDKATIFNRVRGESGAKGGNGFINLYDLNANGVEDSGEAGVIEANITIEPLKDPSMDGDPTRNVATGAAENTPCDDLSIRSDVCYIRVTVRSVHKMLFGFAPAFASIVPLKSSFIMPIRDSFSRGTGSGPPAPVPTCTVPNFIGKKKNQASNLWAGENFTGTLNTGSNPTNYTINSQSLAAGSTQSCTSSILIGP
jgi:hypothetical protein